MAKDNKQPDLSAYRNPALLQFPTDPYGITKDLKKAMLTIASRLKGDDEKMKTVKDTMAILVNHMLARQADEKAAREFTLTAE